MKKAVLCLVLIFLCPLALLMTACEAKTVENVAFGTFYSITLKGKDSNSAIKKAEELMLEIENQLSTAIPTSDIAKINSVAANKAIPVGNHTAAVFLAAKELYSASNKAFNPAIFPLVELWGFAPSNFSGIARKIPTQAEIDALLPFCDFEHFIFDENALTVTKKVSEAKLDFGGIAKGYAVDKIYECFDIGYDEFLINIGGNMSTKGSSKKIGITDAESGSILKEVLLLTNASVATSGDYERYYFYENVRYHHILNQSGYPTVDLQSVTVTGKSAMLCDAYSTAVMILGIEWANSALPKNGYSALLQQNSDIIFVGDFATDG